jgi:acetyl-CoA carboxylase biotin carboxyl carrier protein
MSDQAADLAPETTEAEIAEPLVETTAIPVGPVDVPLPSSRVAASAGPGVALGGGDGALLALVDRLAAILERSDLTELEVEAGGTGLVLRKPEALPTFIVGPAGGGPTAGGPVAAVGGRPGGRGSDAVEAAARPAVTAPLTGIWYSSPSPGSPPFIEVGREVGVGQVIGLIEAMKLFNEIKSDLSGRVVRVLAESGQLVKSKQPLIEVEPL